MSDYLKYLNIIYDYYFNIRSSRSDSIFLNSVFPVYNTKEIKLLIYRSTVFFFWTNHRFPCLLWAGAESASVERPIGSYRWPRASRKKKVGPCINNVNGRLQPKTEIFGPTGNVVQYFFLFGRWYTGLP